MSSALTDTGTSRLGRFIEPQAQAHPGASGIVTLADGREAFAMRALLIEAAEHTIDAQYYMWHDDLSGTLLFEALQRAADRGVRVRLLLDDNRTSGMDEQLAALEAHPNIEVRLFNPFKHRRWRVVDYVGDFTRINRRMHNKAFVVDNQVAILGGRNIGDAYFEAQSAAVMYDLDALAVGSVVHDVSNDFDRYWASDSAYPANRLLTPIGAEQVARLRAEAKKTEAASAASDYMQAVRKEPRIAALMAGELQLEWTTAHFLSDDPAKALGKVKDHELMIVKLMRLLGPPARELQLISPYLVPRRQGVDLLVDSARRGLRVQVLTNSLEATDVAAVHAGYAKWRKQLLDGGVQLFELKRGQGPRERAATDAGDASLGSSAASLHAKMFSADRQRTFIGSFNFDPRSARLNTENGLVIESANIADAMGDAFESIIPQHSYEVRVNGKGHLEWVEQRGDAVLVHEKEPGVSIWQRLMVTVLSVLPIDWLL